MVKTRAQLQHALKGGPPTSNHNHINPNTMKNQIAENQIGKPTPSTMKAQNSCSNTSLDSKKKVENNEPTKQFVVEKNTLPSTKDYQNAPTGVKLEKLYPTTKSESLQKKRKEIDQNPNNDHQLLNQEANESTPQKKSLRPNGRSRGGGIRGTTLSKDSVLPLVLQHNDGKIETAVVQSGSVPDQPRVIIDLSSEEDMNRVQPPETFTLANYTSADPEVLNRIFDSSPNLLNPDTHGDGELSVTFGSKTPATNLDKLNRYTLIAILGEWYRNSIKEEGFMLEHSFESLKDMLVSFQTDNCWDVDPITVKKEWADKYRRKEYKLKGIVTDPNDNPFSLYAQLLPHANSENYFIFYHSLSGTTDSLIIESWAPRVLVQIIQERAKNHELFLPMNILHQFQAHILRKIVFDIQQDISHNREKTILFSSTPISQGTFSAQTQNWEIESFSFQELKTIFWKFLNQTGCELLNKDPDEVTANDLFSTLIELQDKMKLSEIDPVQVCVNLEASTEPTKTLIQAMLTDVEYVDDFDKDNFILSKSTSTTLICTWSPFLLTRFIEMWKVKGKLPLNIQNTEALSAQYLRRIVLDIRNEMERLNSDTILHEEGLYYSTINATTAGWELDAFSFDELKALLRSASSKVGKYFQIESLTQESMRNNLFDILHSEEFRNKDHEVNKTFSATTQVSQQMIDKFFNQRKTAVKTLYTLSKNTIRSEACTWPPLVYVNLLISMMQNPTQAEKYNLILLPSQNLRSRILTKLKELQENQLQEIYKVKDERRGFFSKFTMDWEINGLIEKDARDILNQTQVLLELNGVQPDSLDNIKNALKIARDKLKDKDSNDFFNITHINTRRVYQKQNEDSHIATETDALTGKNPVTFRKLCDSLASYITYNKQDLIEKYKDHFQIKEDQHVRHETCIPVLDRNTPDISMGSWPPKTRIEILRIAGVDTQGLDCADLFQALRTYRNDMQPGKTISALTPYYGFFGTSTNDSKLMYLPEDELKHILITYCKRYGVHVELGFFISVKKDEILEELQMIRAMMMDDIDYRFDLCITLVRTNALDISTPSVQTLIRQIARRTRASKIDRKTLFQHKSLPNKQAGLVAHQIDLEEDISDPEHIMALTQDWEIQNMSIEEARAEFRYQLQYLHRPKITEEALLEWSKSKLFDQLKKIRDSHARVYNTMNLPTNEETSPDSKLTEKDALSSQLEMGELITQDSQMNDMTPTNRDENVKNTAVETSNASTVPDHPKASNEEMEVDNTSPSQNDSPQDEEMNSAHTRSATNMYEALSETTTHTVTPLKQHPKDSTAHPDSNTNTTSSGDIDMDGFQQVPPKKSNQGNQMAISQDPSTTSTDFTLSTPLQNSTPTTVNSKESSSFYVRVRMTLKKSSAHVPSHIKKVIKLFRTTDNSTQLLPFESDVILSQDNIIVHEDLHPDTEDFLKDWIRAIIVNRNNKLCFSFRISAKMSFKDLKAAMMDTLNTNGWWISFDTIEAESIQLLGWFRGIHPKIHNRKMLHSFINSHIPSLKNKFHIYSRAFKMKDPNTNKEVATEAIALEGAFEDNNQALLQIGQIPWSHCYGNVMFVQANLSREFTMSHRQKAYEVQNTYIKNTHTQIVETRDHFILAHQQGQPIYFADWLISRTVDNRRFLQRVELQTETLVRLIYHKDDRHLVSEAIVNLYENVTRYFSPQVAERLLGERAAHDAKLASYNAYSMYAQRCAQSLDKTVIKSAPTPLPKKKLTYYGPKPTDTPMSYANATSGNTQKPPQQTPPPPVSQPSVPSDILTRIQNIENSLNHNKDAEQRITEKLQATFSNEIQTTKQGLETQMQQTRQELDESILSSERRIEQKIDQKVSEYTTQIESIRDLVTETNQRADSQSSSVERIERNQERLLLAIERLTLPPTTTYEPPISAVERGSCHGVVR